ncbi:flavodoxin reductase [Microbacterium sp. ABRD28]|nr:flavodoxin reductase [Microbacterium sp. ABRD28]
MNALTVGVRAAAARVFAVLGRFSMYRVMLLALAALTAVSIVLSLFGALAQTPLEILATGVVLVVACVVVDLAAQRLLRLPWRWESSLITAGILLFVLRPSLDPLLLLGAALAGAIAALSKYVLAWRGRHVLNPAATGASALTLLSIWVPALGASAWWVGSPVLAAPVVILGLIVLWRAEKLRVAALFLVVAVGVALVRVFSQYAALGVPVVLGDILPQVLFSSPFLFLGAFMLSEPLTLPPRRWQQLLVALVVGVLAGWPIVIGAFSLGQERALLIGNLLGFLLAVRAANRLRLQRRGHLSPTVRELTFSVSGPLSFAPGQYLELDVPHRRADTRGTRREFSIASAPEDLPELKIAYREPATGAASSFKRALAEISTGTDLAVTGVWGDFVLPRSTAAPVLLVAAGIGITPFVSQLRHHRLTGEDRDIVLVYVASDAAELAFRDEIAASGVPVIVFTRGAPADLPPHWRWARGVRLDADGLLGVVPDISARHAFVSGPAGLIAELAPALRRARSLTTDAFSGY